MGDIEESVKQHLLAERRELVHKKKMSSALLNDSQASIARITTDFLGYYRKPEIESTPPIEPLTFNPSVSQTFATEKKETILTEERKDTTPLKSNTPLFPRGVMANEIPQESRPISPVTSPRTENVRRFGVASHGQSLQYQDKMANLGDCVATLRTLTVIEHPPDL